MNLSSWKSSQEDTSPAIARLRQISQNLPLQQSQEIPQQKHAFGLWFLFAGIFLIAIAGGVIYFIFYSAVQPTISLSLSQHIVPAGQYLSFVTAITGRSGATILAFVEQSNNIISRSTAIIEPAASLRVLIPSNATAGPAVLRISANSGSITLETRAQFTISKQEAKGSCSDGIKNDGEEGIDCGGLCTPCKGIVIDTCGACDDGDSCTQDVCKNGRCTTEPITPCCGNFKCEAGESPSFCSADCSLSFVTINPTTVVADAVTRSKTDLDKGLLLCSTLSKGYADVCFAKISDSTRLVEPCTHITDRFARDGCFLSYATSTNDFKACDLLENNLYKSSCISLRNLNALK